MARLRTSHGQPPERVNRGFVRRIAPGDKFCFGICSPSFWGFYVHWAGRTLPCYEDKKACPGCRLGYPIKYLGYLYCRNETRNCCEHVELPHDAVWTFLDLVGKDTSLRGIRFIPKRVGGKNGRLEFDLREHLDLVCPEAPLPKDLDPSDVLKYLWGINESKLKLAGTDEIPARKPA